MRFKIGTQYVNFKGILEGLTLYVGPYLAHEDIRVFTVGPWTRGFVKPCSSTFLNCGIYSQILRTSIE